MSKYIVPTHCPFSTTSKNPLTALIAERPMEEQLGQRLNAARESIRAKYKGLETVERHNDPIRKHLVDHNDPIRKHLVDKVNKDVKALRDSLSNDEIVQIQARIDELRSDAAPTGPAVVDHMKPNLFAELQDEYHFLRRLLE
jgi:hypothetical protein